MRTFIAIEFPSNIRQQLDETVRRLRGHLRAHQAPDSLRWAGLHNAHLTLRFLGDTTDAQVQTLAAALDAIARKQPPFELALGCVGGFPNLRQPRVLWLGVGGDMAPLNAAKRSGKGRAAPPVFPPKRGPSRRTSPWPRRPGFKSDLRLVGQLVQDYAAMAQQEPPHFQINEVVHMKSDLQRGGAVHTPVGRFGFGA
ncbi:MAG: RNA 2',3'-cyclic phosphodiesterase [Caldilineaceae bacterium]